VSAPAHEKGEVVSYAEEVCSKVEPIGMQKVEVAEQGGQENGKQEIPEHLTNLFDKSKGGLNEQEQTQLSELLCEFEDVFAKSEFDLGKFNTIQHGIDTGTNPMPTQTLMAGSPSHSTFSLIGPLLLLQTLMGNA
jgi:hypothetical protein